MKIRYVLLPLLLVLTLSAQIRMVERNPQNDYFNYLQARTNDELTRLNGTWKMRADEADEWSSVELPATLYSTGRYLFRRSFTMPERFRSVRNILHIGGIGGQAIIRLNGQVIENYHYHGPPVDIILDPKRIDFGQKNVLEIEVDFQLNYDTSIPRAPIFREPRVGGGLMRDIFIRHKKAIPYKHPSFHASNRQIQFQLDGRFADSIPDYRFQFTVDVLRDDLTLTRSFTQSFRQIEGDTVRMPIDRLLARRETYTVPTHGFLRIRGIRFNRFRLDSLPPARLPFSSIKQQSGPLRIISMMEQHPDGHNQLSLSEMEADFRRIKAIGFTAVFYPFDYPHPYVYELARKYGLTVYSGLPVYTLTDAQFRNPTSMDQLKTIISHLDPRMKPVLHSTLESNAIETIATHLNIDYIHDGTLHIGNRDIPIIDPRLAKFEDLSGYLIPGNEEYQAKYIRDELAALTGDDLMIQYLTDYRTANPSVRNLQLGSAMINQSGIQTVDRRDKKAVRVLRSVFQNTTQQAFAPGDEQLNEQFAFIILGLVTLAIFVIGFRQAAKLSDNIKRSFFHAHGFFTDTRERRILYMGQTLYVGLLQLLILSNILATHLYYHNISDSLHLFISYFFAAGMKQSVVELANNPVSLQITSAVLLLVFMLIIYVFIKITSFFSRRRVNTRQSMTVIIWALIPILFLLPVSIFMYQALLSQVYVSLISYSIIIILVWALLRLINAIRVIADISHTRVYATGIICLIVFLGLLMLIFEFTHTVSDYYLLFAAL